MCPRAIVVHAGQASTSLGPSATSTAQATMWSPTGSPSPTGSATTSTTSTVTITPTWSPQPSRTATAVATLQVNATSTDVTASGTNTFTVTASPTPTPPPVPAPQPWSSFPLRNANFTTSCPYNGDGILTGSGAVDCWTTVGYNYRYSECTLGDYCWNSVNGRPGGSAIPTSFVDASGGACVDFAVRPAASVYSGIGVEVLLPNGTAVDPLVMSTDHSFAGSYVLPLNTPLVRLLEVTGTSITMSLLQATTPGLDCISLVGIGQLGAATNLTGFTVLVSKTNVGAWYRPVLKQAKLAFGFGDAHGWGIQMAVRGMYYRAAAAVAEVSPSPSPTISPSPNPTISPTSGPSQVAAVVGRCSFSGDPHLTTFSGARTDFYGVANATLYQRGSLSLVAQMCPWSALATGVRKVSLR
jgi:hypothetical protein